MNKKIINSLLILTVVAFGEVIEMLVECPTAYAVTYTTYQNSGNSSITYGSDGSRIEQINENTYYFKPTGADHWYKRASR